MKEEFNVKEIVIKKEIVFIQKENLPSSTVEDTCTVYVQEEIPSSSTVEDTCTVYVKEEIPPSCCRGYMYCICTGRRC